MFYSLRFHLAMTILKTTVIIYLKLHLVKGPVQSKVDFLHFIYIFTLYEIIKNYEDAHFSLRKDRLKCLPVLVGWHFGLTGDTTRC